MVLEDDILITFSQWKSGSTLFPYPYIYCFYFFFFWDCCEMYGQLHKLSNHNVGGAVDNTNQTTKRLNATT